MGVWSENRYDSLSAREERKVEFAPETVEEEREFPPIPRKRKTTAVKRAAKKAAKKR